MRWGEDDASEWDESVEIEVSREEAEEKAQEMVDKMNDDQWKAYNTLISAFRFPEKHRYYFLDVSCSMKILNFTAVLS